MAREVKMPARNKNIKRLFSAYAITNKMPNKENIMLLHMGEGTTPSLKPEQLKANIHPTTESFRLSVILRHNRKTASIRKA